MTSDGGSNANSAEEFDLRDQYCGGCIPWALVCLEMPSVVTWDSRIQELYAGSAQDRTNLWKSLKTSA